MTEFTSEFIEKQKEQLKHISPLPWRACSCGKCGQIRNNQDCIAIATRGDWGDDYPVIKPVGGSIGGQYEVVMEQITYGHISPEIGNINSQYIAEACTNYPEALNEIEKLQQRVKELEQERQWIPVSERLPEDTRIYDVAIADYEYSWTGSCVFGKWIGESGKAILGVTHWKHRVQPPDEYDNESVNNPVHWKPLKGLKE